MSGLGLCQGCERLPVSGFGYCDICRKVIRLVWNGEPTQLAGDLRLYAEAAIDHRINMPKPPGSRWGDGGELCNICAIAPAVSVGLCSSCRLEEGTDFKEIPNGYRCSQCHAPEGFHHEPDCRGERRLIACGKNVR